MYRDSRGLRVVVLIEVVIKNGWPQPAYTRTAAPAMAGRASLWRRQRRDEAASNGCSTHACSLSSSAGDASVRPEVARNLEGRHADGGGSHGGDLIVPPNVARVGLHLRTVLAGIEIQRLQPQPGLVEAAGT